MDGEVFEREIDHFRKNGAMVLVGGKDHWYPDDKALTYRRQNRDGIAKIIET